MPLCCDVCGNDRQPGRVRCPFCGEKYADGATCRQKRQFRIVNLEKGMPTVEQALKRLDCEIERARAEGVTLLQIIHGYGSSGKGGRIRLEGRKYLTYLAGSGRIRSIVHGEMLTRKGGVGKDLFRRCPELAEEGHLERNKGITLVEL